MHGDGAAQRPVLGHAPEQVLPRVRAEQGVVLAEEADSLRGGMARRGAGPGHRQPMGGDGDGDDRPDRRATATTATDDA